MPEAHGRARSGHVGLKPEPEHRFVEQTLIAGIARHAGKDRVYCEAFGISSFDIRLGQMLRCAQMLGIHGVNDIALMGFQQSIDGVRKRSYWPPIFDQAPWWPFYPEFRDAFARSVALSSLGERVARYAILYPQNQLEQTDLFNIDISSGTDPASRMINTLALAVYAAGETFDFVFPEILSQARVSGGKIVFPHAVYDAILAPSDVAYFDESAQVLSDLQAAEGTVLRGDLESVVDEIRGAGPSWAERVTIGRGGLRVYRFEYPDGELFALRNVSDSRRGTWVDASAGLSEWDPVSGEITSLPDGCRRSIRPHSTCYYVLSGKTFGKARVPPRKHIPIRTTWTVRTDFPNMARLAGLEFGGGDKWHAAISPPVYGPCAGQPSIGIPPALRGETTIPMRGRFECRSVPESVLILFEKNHLTGLSVNDSEVDLSAAYPLRMWDSSCMAVDIAHLARTGANIVRGALEYKSFETGTTNDAFLDDWLMPGCDVFLGGSFRVAEGAIESDEMRPMKLPIDLSERGWREYDGILSLTSTVEIDEPLARSITGVKVGMLAEDCLELLIDGKPLSRALPGRTSSRQAHLRPASTP